ncbi:MAG: RDD family protein, partial [Thermoplasmata archaeon]
DIRKDAIFWIGGAGGLDLVFLAGLFAIGPLFFLAPKGLRRSKAEVSATKSFENNIKKLLEHAESMLNSQKYELAFESALQAVDMKIQDVGSRLGVKQSPYVTLRMLNVNPFVMNDYWLLSNASRTPEKTFNDTYAAVIAAGTIVEEMEKVESRLLASNLQRIVAFLVDMAIIVLIMMLFFYLGGVAGLYDLKDILGLLESIWFLAMLMWLWVAQAIYFTLFESLSGQSPGKRLIGIRVISDDYSRCDFMDAFTRNVVRFLDMVMLVYLISLMIMNLYPKRQRFGDLVAQTLVIKA